MKHQHENIIHICLYIHVCVYILSIHMRIHYNSLIIIVILCNIYVYTFKYFNSISFKALLLMANSLAVVTVVLLKD